MYQLIITVMSIALASSAVMIQTKYTNPLLPAQQAAQERIEEGFKSLNVAWDAYRAENQTYGWSCDTYTTDMGSYESCRQVMTDPGFLPVAGWSETLIPKYGFMPRAPQGMVWSYGKNDAGWYFCAEGRASDPQLKGFTRAQNSFPVDSLILSDTCGVTTSLPAEQLNPSNLKITYWIKLNDIASDGFAVRLIRGEVNRPMRVATNFYSKGVPVHVPPNYPDDDSPVINPTPTPTPVECELGNGNGNGNGYGNNQCSGNGKGNGKGNAVGGAGNGNGGGKGRWRREIGTSQLANSAYRQPMHFESNVYQI